MLPLPPECTACLIDQGQRAGDLARVDIVQKLRLRLTLTAYFHEVQAADLRQVENDAHDLIRCYLGGDPYRPARQAATRQALALYPRLSALVAAAPDPLAVAVRIAAAGNAIDLAACASYDLDAALQAALTQPLAIDQLTEFRGALAQSDRLVYLGDNAGETVFDRVLIETIDLPTTYVVKGGPSINDVLREDALAAELGRVASLLSNGTNWIGTHLPAISPACREVLENAPLILAKGQANMLTLDGFKPAAGRCFFLLKVKCAPMARFAGAPLESHVLFESRQMQ